jgi:hypothetical protein
VGAGKQEEGQVPHGDDDGDRSTGPEEPEPSLQGGKRQPGPAELLPAARRAGRDQR